MDLEMEVSMMVMLVVREISCVGVTTAGNSELITMRRTTAVREQPLHSNPPSLPSLIGMRSRSESALILIVIFCKLLSQSKQKHTNSLLRLQMNKVLRILFYLNN